MTFNDEMPVPEPVATQWDPPVGHRSGIDDNMVVVEPEVRQAESGELEEGEVGQGSVLSAPDDKREVAVDERQRSANALGVLRSEKAFELEYSLEDLSLALDTVAYECNGFTGDPVEMGPDHERVDWETTRKLLGDGKWRNNPVHSRIKTIELDKALREPIMQHLYLVESSPIASFHTVPSLDLADLSNFIHLYKSWPFSVRKLPVDGVTWYMLTEKTNQLRDGLHLLICDPVTVVQVIRCNWGSTVPEVADQLVNYGIRFHTLCKGRRVEQVQQSVHSSQNSLPRSILGY
ncbi:hypothetical protein PM082_024537 [Marasmius tenuissimus]|nr:hypothetical protein PM082_024537 [Marasmius tenuissimus]